MNGQLGPDTIRIDGSYGEGGGQVLRTSLALSCVLGKPMEITNIRKARKSPGLRPQHRTAVLAAASITGAEVQGAELSSTALRFRPNRTSGGSYRFDVAEKQGSAGSVTLVLQTILLPLCFAEQPSMVMVNGGTHVPWSPSFHYLHSIVVPLLSGLGARIELSLTSWGWYPIGNGQVSARITPSTALRPLTLIDRGGLVRVTGISAVSNLPGHIATRQCDRAVSVLGMQGIDASIETLSATSLGKGSFLFLAAEFEHISAGFGSLGAIGKRAEEVADEACDGLLSHLRSKGALDPHLADQIVPWLAFCQGTSEFTTSRVTRHLLTNLWVLQQFMDVDVQVKGSEGEEGRVMIRPVGRNTV
ncbi:MAG: RNA 3'-phosphate cyclase [Nitrospirae bacterium]|nr:RNA 3'-phosphate cyclase [Nitrospirota bacterium]NTW65421.1 RNA 3'-phosphate cyclase [Nitrospirota bacterium]